MFYAILAVNLLAACSGGKEEGDGIPPGSLLPYEIDAKGTINRFLANEKNSKEIKIPSTYSLNEKGQVVSGTAYQIKGIGDHCFSNNSLVQKITVPETIINICSYAFYNCPNLDAINVPSSVASIGEGAFEQCPKLMKISCYENKGMILPENDNLTSFSLPSSIKEISYSVFKGWDNLRSFVVPESVEAIGADSISSNPLLSSVTIESEIDRLGDNVFSNCPLLTSVRKRASESGISFLKPQKFKKFIIPSSVNSIDPQMFYDWDALQEIYIPESVASLETIFHRNTALKKISCPNAIALSLFYAVEEGFGDTSEQPQMYKVKPISSHASRTIYYYIPESLEEFHVLNGTSIETSTFFGMNSLKTIYLPSTTTFLQAGSFSGCTNLSELHLKTDSDWVYENKETILYGETPTSNAVSKAIVNNPTAFASYVKKFSNYNWHAAK